MMVDCGSGPRTNTTIRYCDIHHTFNNPHIVAIGPRNLTAEYNDISHVIDAFAPSLASGEPDVNLIIRGNYIHDFMFVGPPPDYTHDPTPLYTVAGIDRSPARGRVSPVPTTTASRSRSPTTTDVTVVGQHHRRDVGGRIGQYPAAAERDQGTVVLHA